MLSIFFIGVALSMDAFSIAISLGTNKLSNSKMFLIPFTIGIMHFIMPFLGLKLGTTLLNVINVNSKLIISIIFLYLAIMMFIERKNEKKNIISNIFSIFLLAFSVSIDSFSVGLGLMAITNKYLLSFLLFSSCSFSITYIGILIGKYSIKLLKDKAPYIGIIILLILSIVNFCKVFQ